MAAPRRRLRSLRAVPGPRKGSRSRLRRRPQLPPAGPAGDRGGRHRPEALEGQGRDTVVADMRALPFDDASFSSVVAVQSIEHVPDPERAVAEAARVLEPDGAAVFVTPNRLTLGDPMRSSTLPLRRIRPGRAPRSVRAIVRRGRNAGVGWLRCLHGAVQGRAHKARQVAALGPPTAAARWCRGRSASRSTTASCGTTDRTRILVPRRSASATSSFEATTSRDLSTSVRCAAPAGPGEYRSVGFSCDRGTQPRVANCAWCGSPLDGSAVRLRGRTQCPACGAATTDPWPSEEQLQRAYGSWYRPESGRFAFIGDPLLRRTRALLAGRLDRIAPPGPVLDVGAGEAVLIDALRRRGREAVGLERDSRRQDMRDDPLERVEGEWAAVVFWHSLEHLPDPGGAIREAARLLRPGGIVVIAVPNTDSLQARRSATAGCIWTRPFIWSTSRSEPCAPGLPPAASRWSASRTSAVGRS